MKFIIGILVFILSMDTQLLFDFNKNSNLENWSVVDDEVMGGRSQGSFSLSDGGHGQFSGEISLQNNGGFSSVKYEFSPIALTKDHLIRIRLKGDGKKYQFRVKHKTSDYASYISYFDTNGDWQDVEFQLGDLYPTFRGRKLNESNFNHNSIEEIRFLIGNEKPESFNLLIDKIELIKE